MELTLKRENMETQSPQPTDLASIASREILIISVNGELDTNTAGTLETRLAEEYESGARTVILELSEMDYVSSVGLRVLLAHLKKLKASQGRLVLSGLNAEVQEIFDMAGFSSLFEISPDLEAARQILRA